MQTHEESGGVRGVPREHGLFARKVHTKALTEFRALKPRRDPEEYVETYEAMEESLWRSQVIEKVDTKYAKLWADELMIAPSNGAIFAVGLYFTFSVSLPRSVALGPASSITNSARTARTAAQHATLDMHSADTRVTRPTQQSQTLRLTPFFLSVRIFLFS